MPVQITINCENAAQAIEEFTTLSAAFNGGAAPVEEPKTRQQRKGATTPVTSKEEDKLGKDDPKTKAEQEASSSDEVIPTLVELRAKAQEVAKAGKQPKIKSLLDEFGFKSISDVAEESRSVFLRRLEDL